MKAVKETDLKRTLGEVLFEDFLVYMKGRTFINSTTEPMYYKDNISDYVRVMFYPFHIRKKYFEMLNSVEIEV